LFKEHPGVEYKITGDFKPSARLLKSLRKLVGCLIITLPSKIIILQLECQETAWIEFTLYNSLQSCR